MRARDAHRSATMLTLLVFLWGASALLIDPLDPFGIPSAVQAVGCGPLLVYFLRTWNRPQRRVAEIVGAILIVYALLLLPWHIVVWCRLGRPVDAFFLPQVAAVSMALVFPGRWWLGVTAMGLFGAQGLFAFFYARYLGLHALIPITEPLATFAFTTLGSGLFIVRRRRHELARQYVRVQAEIQALERVRPQFARAQQELEEQLAILAKEEVSNGAGHAETSPRAVDRALDRLDDLRGKLRDVAAVEPSSASPPEAERRLLAHDAQLGAILLAAIATALAIPALWTTRGVRGDVPAPTVAPFVIAAAILVYLVRTRREPSSRRALWTVLVVVVTQLAAITYNQVWLVDVNRPYMPLLGHKLLMGVLGLTLTTRFKLGIALIFVTAANALVLWFALDLDAHRDIIALGEPVNTLVYMVIGIGSLRLLEQREIASVQLLRAEAEAAAMYRRARMFLALRDRLNSPLQTLVLGSASATEHLSVDRAERVQGAIDRLVQLSRELAELEVAVSPAATSLDADRELSAAPLTAQR